MSKDLKEVRRVSHVDMRGKSIQEEEITKGPKAAMPCIRGSSQKHVQETSVPRREKKSGQR